MTNRTIEDKNRPFIRFDWYQLPCSLMVGFKRKLDSFIEHNDPDIIFYESSYCEIGRIKDDIFEITTFYHKCAWLDTLVNKLNSLYPNLNITRDKILYLYYKQKKLCLKTGNIIFDDKPYYQEGDGYDLHDYNMQLIYDHYNLTYDGRIIRKGGKR